MGSWYSAKYADMICILSSLYYVIAESKAFVFAFKICLRHQLRRSSERCTTPKKKFWIRTGPLIITHEIKIIVLPL